MSTLLELQDTVAAELLALRRRVAEFEQAARSRAAQTGAAQNRAERNLEVLADCSVECVAIHRAGGLLHANPAFLRLAALPDLQSAQQRHLQRDLHLPTHTAGAGHGLADDAGGTEAFSWRDPAGRERFLIARSRSVEWDGAAAIRSAFVDVTAWRESEERTRAQTELDHRRLLDAIESIPASFHLFDAGERFVLANRRAWEMFPEYRDLYVPGTPFRELMGFAYDHGLIGADGVGREEWLAGWEARVKNPPDFYEYQRHDGRWIRLYDRRTSEGGRVSIRFDYTAEKQREQELRRIREGLRSIIELSELPMVVHRNFKPLFANQGFATLFGYESPLEVLALPDILVTIPEAMRKPAMARHTARMAGIAEPGRYEREGVREDGSTLWVDAFATVMEWAGEPALLVAYVDITERKAIEEALRASEARLRHLIERFPLAVLVHRELKPLFVNRAYADLMGYSSVADVLALADVSGSANPADLPMIRGHYRRLVLENAEPIRLEREAIRPDGTRLWVHVLITAVQWEGEIAVLAVYIDDTKGKQAEQELKRSAERYRHLFEENAFAMLVHRNQMPIYVNPAFARLFGYDSPEQVLALETVYAIVDGSEHARLNEYAERRLRAESAPSQFVFRGVRKDGSPMWVMNTATTLDWEGDTAILATMQDVTELKQAEEDRNASEQRFRDFAQVASDWFWETGPDHRFTYMSGRIDEVLQRNESSFLGHARWEMTPYEGVDWDAHRADLEARRPLRDFTFPTPDGLGQRRYVRLNGKPIFGEQGQFLGYRGTGTDISAEMAAREEAESSHARLIAAIESMPATFVLYDAEGRLVLMNSKLRETFAAWAHCYAVGRTYSEIVECVAASQMLKESRGREAEWMVERLNTFRNPPESRDISLDDGRWMRSFDRRTQDGGTVSIRWDITELKRREEALRTSEERFRGLAEGSIQGIIVHRDFSPVFANPAFLEMFGFSNLEQVLALDLHEMPYIAPRERERVLGYAKARLRGDPAPTRYRFEGIRRDGSPVWADIAVSIVRWDGEPAVLATYSDVSEYIRADQARRVSEEKFRNLVEGSIQGVLIHRKFKPVYANEALVRILGYDSVEELVGLPSAIVFVAPEERARVQEIGGRRLKGEDVPERYEFLAQRKDGGRIWVEIFNRRIEWEGDRAVQAVFYDVTERVRAENELRSSRELLQTVFDALPVWVSMKDREGRILMVNRQCQVDSGISVDNFKRMRTEDQPFLSPEVVELLMADEQRVLNGESTDSEFEIMLHPKGRRSHHTVKVPFRGPAGDVIGIVTVAEDITDRKVLEDELRQAQKMEAIGQLAGGVAHDFNNLLQIISGYTQFVMREFPDNPDAQRDLGQVLEAADRGSQLTRQLLAFGRRQLLQRIELNLNDSVNNLTKLLRRLFEENIEIVSAPGANLMPVLADSGMIEQVLLNLCLNARDAMPAGGVLSISSGNAVLDRDFCERNPGARPGRCTWIRVADTGEGIEPDHLSRIFEPFFTTKELGKGTGLGLAMAYGIIRQHDGVILVESKPGQGAVFTIYLPSVQTAGPVAPDVDPSVESPRGRETILVAEDERRVRDMAERVLTGAGYTVLTASDGVEAMKVFEANIERIDLILLDVIMPGRDGKVVYEQVRRRSPALPVLFCSGYSGGSISEQLQEDLPVKLLQKPFRSEDLLLMVREMLDRAMLMAR